MTSSSTEKPLPRTVREELTRPAVGLWRRLAPKLVLSLILGALFAWLAARGGLPLLPSWEALSRVQWWAVPVYLGTLLIVHYFRASRWRFLIDPVKRLPLREVVAVNWVGFFAIFALPLRLGEIVRPALCKMREGIPMSAGFGTVAVERVVDGLVTSLCVAWALFALPRLPTQDPVARHLPVYGYAALMLFACAFAALAMFLWQRRLAARLTRWGFGLLSPKLGELIASKVSSVADGLRSIGRPGLAGAFLAETLLYWGANALGVWLLGLGCGLPMGLGHAVAVMGVLAIGILLPTGPGLFGNFQLAVSATLQLFFAQQLLGGPGAAFIFLMYACQASVMVLAGVVPLYAMHLRVRDLVLARA